MSSVFYETTIDDHYDPDIDYAKVIHLPTGSSGICLGYKIKKTFTIIRTVIKDDFDPNDSTALCSL